MDAPYRTVASSARAELDVKGSRFIGHVAPASSVEAARSFIGAVGAEHADATHNVPAYRVRASPVEEWSSDDGEPGGSAGRPVLTFLQHEDLLDAVVVVTRYYGGTKLGVGGLVRAYTQAAKATVEAAGVVARRPTRHWAFSVPYDEWGAVRAVLEGAGVAYKAAYGAHVQVEADVAVVDAAGVRERLASATRGRVDPGAED